MTEKDITREQALETLRAVKSYIDPAWNSETLRESNELLRDAVLKVDSEIQRLEQATDYVTPGPAPVDLYFLKPDYEAASASDPEDEFGEMIWDVMGEYDVPVTNNEMRWQDGRWLREAGAFVGHIKDAVAKSGAFVTRREYDIVERIKDDAIEVANAEKRKRIETELELEMWQKGYRKK